MVKGNIKKKVNKTINIDIIENPLFYTICIIFIFIAGSATFFIAMKNPASIAVSGHKVSVSYFTAIDGPAIILRPREDIAIESITLNNVEKESVKNIAFGDINDYSTLPEIKGSSIIRAFEIDPSKVNFRTGSFIYTAKGYELYVCKKWNTKTKTCSGDWKKVMDTTPGVKYAIEISPDDPAFIEYSSNCFQHSTGTGKALFNYWETTPLPSNVCARLQVSDNSTANQTAGQNNVCGIAARFDNASVAADCATIPKVIACVDWFTAVATEWLVQVGNNGTSTTYDYYNVSTSSPGTLSSHNLTCYDVSSYRNWTCNDFSSNRSVITVQAKGGKPECHLDRVYFNLTYPKIYGNLTLLSNNLAIGESTIATCNITCADYNCTNVNVSLEYYNGSSFVLIPLSGSVYANSSYAYLGNIEKDTTTNATFNITKNSTDNHILRCNITTNNTMNKTTNNVTFTFQDINPPVILDTFYNPNPIYQNYTLNISAMVIDNSFPIIVKIMINNTNHTMEYAGNSWYYYSGFNTNVAPGIYNYTIYASDYAGNNATPLHGSFEIVPYRYCGYYASQNGHLIIQKTITINGEFDDWDDVLLNDEQVVSDPAGAQDADNPPQADRDATLFAYTYDTNYIYFYIQRVATGANVARFEVYLDSNLNAKMESDEKVAVFTYSGSNRKWSSTLHNYIPANSSGDDIGGDGVPVAGTLGTGTDIETGVTGGDIGGIIVETRISWQSINLSPGTPINFKLQVANPSGYNTDNINPINMSLLGVLITPNYEVAVEPGKNYTFRHYVQNIGNQNSTFNLSSISQQGWTTVIKDVYGNIISDTGVLECNMKKIVDVVVSVPFVEGLDDTIKTTAQLSTNQGINNTIIDILHTGGVSIYPNYTIKSTNLTPAFFEHVVYNSQSFPDVININTTSTLGLNTWVVFSENKSLLTDTNGDGYIDVGNISSGSFVNITVYVDTTQTTIGETDVTTVTATSATNSSRYDSVNDTTYVQQMISLRENQSTSSGPNTNVYLTHTITNAFNQTSVIDINLSQSLSWGYEILYYIGGPALNDSNGNGLLDINVSPFGGEKSFVIKFLIPSNATINTTNFVNVTALYYPNQYYDKNYDNISVQVLLTFQNPARTIPQDKFGKAEVVYAKAFALQTINNVYFVWVDANNTIVRTSPIIPVDSNLNALDNYTIPMNAVYGNWSLVVYNNHNNNLIASHIFEVIDKIPPVINYIDVAPNPVNYTNITNITVNVTDDYMVDIVRLNISNTIYNMISAGNDIYYFENFNTSQYAGVYYFYVLANDTSNNNATQKQGNVTINPLQAIELINYPVNFTDITPGETKNASLSQGFPTIVKNIGNVFLNITVNGSDLVGETNSSYIINVTNIDFGTDPMFISSSSLSYIPTYLFSINMSENKSVYFRINAPLYIISQNYSGNITFNSIIND